MNQFQSSFRTALGVLTLTLTVACSAGGVSVPKPSSESAVAAETAPAPAQAPVQSGDALLAKVQQLIGLAPCENDAQCRSLPLGARACGGPDQHLARSVTGTEAVALQRAADRYTQWQAQAQRRGAVAGICVVEVDPGAYCKKSASGAGRCTLRNSAAGDPVVR